MGSLCLSSATILRCESFTRIENIALIVPTVVEIIFSTSLIFTIRGSGWTPLLLTAEGWIYLALALLELLSHIIPAVRTNLDAFRVVDITLGATSSLPLLFYTAFLFLFARSELLDVLPQRFRGLANILLIFFIPPIIALNEVASFIGITRQAINTGRGLPPTLAIGFKNNNDKTLWTFFTSFTLALLTAYQAINFSFAFLRLLKVFFHQRRIEKAASDEAHLFKGMGWITGAIKLGAIETVIGFANGGFGGALTRRILRFLARACLCIGLIKGVDTAVDFRQFRDEMAGKRKSRLRPLISNPRFSTFQKMSPKTTQFFNGLGPPDKDEKASLRNPQRVTVHFDEASGRAPTLEMRFSVLDLPSPAALVESIKSRPVSEIGLRRQSSYYANSTMTRFTDLPAPPRTATGAESLYAPSTLPNVFATMSSSDHSHNRGRSDYSGYRDSVNSMSLAASFPGLPPRVTTLAEKQKQEALLQALQGNNSFAAAKSSSRSPPGTGTLSASNSFKRKPAPRASLVLEPAPIDPFGEDDGVTIPPPLPAAEHAYQMSVALSDTSQTPLTLNTNQWSSPVSLNPSSFTSPSGTSEHTEDPFKYDQSQSDMVLTGKSRGDLKRVPSELPSVRESAYESEHMRGKRSMETLDISWLKPTEDEGDYDEEEYIEEGTVKLARKTTVSRQSRPPLGRIKSVGKAPRKYTPTPVKTSLARGSIYIEPIVIPPRHKDLSEVELEQGSNTPSLLGGGALRDSDVLGVDDR